MICGPDSFIVAIALTFLFILVWAFFPFNLNQFWFQFQFLVFMVGIIFFFNLPVRAYLYNDFCTCRRIHSGMDLRQGIFFKTSGIDKEIICQSIWWYVPTWCMQSTLGSVTGKGRLNEIFIMCICLLLKQTTYSIATGPPEGLKIPGGGARGNVVGIIYPLVDIGLIELIWKKRPRFLRPCCYYLPSFA